MIDKLTNNPVHTYASSVYDYNELSLQELLSKFFNKINECVELSNKSFSFLEWLKSEGVPTEVIKEINLMYSDGRLTELINGLSSDVKGEVLKVKEILDQFIIETNQFKTTTNQSMTSITNQLGYKASITQLETERKRIDEHQKEYEQYRAMTNQLINSANSQIETLENQKAEKKDISSLENRIDNLIIHSGEGTQNNSEVVDSRSNIVSYATLGTNIRTTTNNIYSLIKNVFDLKKEMITNLLDKSNMTDGKLINASGVESTQAGCSFTNDYLFLKSGESITINFSTYYTIAKYNTSKVFTGNTIVNNENLPYTLTANEDMYLRFNIYTAKKDTAMVVKGSVLPSKYIGYGEKMFNPTDITFNEVEKIAKVIDGNFYSNLLNKLNMTDGKLINASGNESVQEGCSFTNDYLLIKKGESITLNFATYITILCYDLNKKFKTNIKVNNEDLPFTYVATEDLYLRFNVYTGKKDTAMVVKGSALPSSYIPYNQYVIKDVTFNKFYDVLSGKYLFVGDSICYGSGASEKGGYAKLIANLNPKMTYKNIGVGGATLCRRTVTNPGTSILNKIEEEIALNSSYNHIVLEGGLNDLWNQATWQLGTYDEYDRTSVLNELTICGAFESLIRKCKAKWSDSFIYYVIPHSIDVRNTKLGFDTLKAICRKYNVIVIDLRVLSGQDVAVDYVKQTYTLTDGIGDGVHNNDLGYTKFYIKPIINILSNYQ